MRNHRSNATRQLQSETRSPQQLAGLGMREELVHAPQTLLIELSGHKFLEAEAASRDAQHSQGEHVVHIVAEREHAGESWFLVHREQIPHNEVHNIPHHRWAFVSSVNPDSDDVC